MEWHWEDLAINYLKKVPSTLDLAFVSTNVCFYRIIDIEMNKLFYFLIDEHGFRWWWEGVNIYLEMSGSQYHIRRRIS